MKTTSFWYLKLLLVWNFSSKNWAVLRNVSVQGLCIPPPHGACIVLIASVAEITLEPSLRRLSPTNVQLQIRVPHRGSNWILLLTHKHFQPPKSCHTLVSLCTSVLLNVHCSGTGDLLFVSNFKNSDNSFQFNLSICTSVLLNVHCSGKFTSPFAAPFY